MHTKQMNQSSISLTREKTRFQKTHRGVFCTRQGQLSIHLFAISTLGWHVLRISSALKLVRFDATLLLQAVCRTIIAAVKENTVKQRALPHKLVFKYFHADGGADHLTLDTPLSWSAGDGGKKQQLKGSRRRV
jgi:hypothetical protein